MPIFGVIEENEMALPIKPTEPISEEKAEEFLKQLKENEENPGQDELEFPDIKHLVLEK